jgi:hypothetical protein
MMYNLAYVYEYGATSDTSSTPATGYHAVIRIRKIGKFMAHPVPITFKFFGPRIMAAGFQGVMIEHTGIPGAYPLALKIPGFIRNIETITGRTNKCANSATNTPGDHIAPIIHIFKTTREIFCTPG